MSNEEKTCQGCKYVIADTRKKRCCYRCTNQESESFGKSVTELAGCDGYDRLNPRPDMPFKDALDQLVMNPPGTYGSWFFNFGDEGELSRPFMCITFVDNKQMLEYRDALERCFDELMKLKREAGDFKEDSNNEQ